MVGLERGLLEFYREDVSDSDGRVGVRKSERDLARRSQELADAQKRLLRKMIDTAALVRQSHERVAATMDLLADKGGEHASRRRRLAETSRQLAEEEARDIAALRDRQMGDQSREGVEPDTV